MMKEKSWKWQTQKVPEKEENEQNDKVIETDRGLKRLFRAIY